METIRRILILIGVGLVVGIYIGKTYFPIVQQEKLSQTEKTEKKVTVREKFLKNGTIIKETITQNKLSKKLTVEPTKHKYHVNLTQQLWDKDNTKTLSVSRRIGDSGVFATGTLNTKGHVTIGLGFDF